MNADPLTLGATDTNAGVTIYAILNGHVRHEGTKQEHCRPCKGYDLQLRYIGTRSLGIPFKRLQTLLLTFKFSRLFLWFLRLFLATENGGGEKTLRKGSGSNFLPFLLEGMLCLFGARLYCTLHPWYINVQLESACIF